MRFAGLLLLTAALAGAQETLLVVHKHGNSLGMFDAGTGQSIATVAVGLKPHEMALSADGKLVYVTNYGVDSWSGDAPGGNTISVVDLAKRRVVADIDLGRFRRPHGIELGRSGRLYVTTDLPPTLLVIDPKKRAIDRFFDIGQKAPHMVAVTADERTAFTANSGAGAVTVIDLRSAQPARHIQVGGVPMGFALTSDDRLLFVATRTANQVVVVDTASAEVARRFDIPGQPVRLRLIPGEKLLLVTTIEAGDLAVVDAASGAIVRRLPVGAHAEGISIDPGGAFAYASAQGENKVVKFSLSDWKKALEIKTGARPDPTIILKMRP